MEFVVLFASFKYFFVEGGQQFIVGLETSKKIGLKPTVKITFMGASFMIILFFLFFFSRVLVPANKLELILGVTLYYFSLKMFKEAKTAAGDEDGSNGRTTLAVNSRSSRYGYIHLVIMESIENSSILAALTFVDISGALLGAVIPIGLFVVLAVKGKRIFDKMPLNRLRLISGILLALLATPLIIYSSGLPTPSWLHWIIPPLG